jgi:histidyl-tRNA synthetase
MASAKTQPARGMRDFLPEDVRRREYVIGVIKEVYERYGFEPLETPAVENIETLMGKYGEEGNQLIFKILQRGLTEIPPESRPSDLTDLALRYDLTVPLARVVAQYRDKLPKFFKRYQIQPVWRADRPARGRFREFYQCDVDVLGSKSMVVEAEICGAVSDVLRRLGFKDFVIRVNSRLQLYEMLSAAELPPAAHSDALVAIDKLDKIGVAGVINELSEKGLAGDKAIALIKRLWAVKETAQDPSYGAFSAGQEVERFLNGSVVGASESLTQFGGFFDYVRYTPAAEHIRFDPSLARGLSYYTGMIMEINVPDLSGSLGGGGRYDNLVGMFLGQDVPACGFSLGLERLIVVMTERGMFPEDLASSPADVMVTIWNEDSINESIAVAHELRSAGLRVDLYPEADKVGKQFKYASSRGIRFVAVLGDDERARGEVAIKDMKSGEQRSVGRAEVAAVLRDWKTN